MMNHMQKLMNRGVYLLIAGLVSSTLLILACGGDDAPTPTPTQTQTATAAPGVGGDGSNSVGETPTPTDTTTGGASSSVAETLFVPAKEFDTVTVKLNAGDVLQVTFDVESSITGGHKGGEGGARKGIQVVISDPFGSPILSNEEVTASGTVEVQAEVTGDHKVVFINPFPLEAQRVEVDYIVNP
jgi:hypothetical protein